jgi:hypothetical protein
MRIDANSSRTEEFALDLFLNVRQIINTINDCVLNILYQVVFPDKNKILINELRSVSSKSDAFACVIRYTYF